MIRKNVRDIEGSEVLARDIMTWDYQIILPQGATIRKEHIEKLDELGITEVYVKKADTQPGEIVILKEETEKSIKKSVKDILERHTYQKNDELLELNNTADSIISDITEEEEVVEKVFDIRERSADIYEHSISICSLAILTALKLGVERKKIHDIGVGCLLHDIGLRYMTIDYKNQYVDTMNKQELTEYKKHPVYGYSSLKDEPWISELSKMIILSHHERLDGSGYPLHTKEIPFECRIVSVCDTFDEMICGIGCKRTKVYEAIEYIKQFKNVQFDPRIVDVFLGFTAVYPAGSRVLTSEGEIAEVLSQNKEFQDRPVIRILKDKDNRPVKGNVIKDLVKVQNVFIEKVID